MGDRPGGHSASPTVWDRLNRWLDAPPAARPQTCANCNAERPVWTRTSSGEPLCCSCSKHREPCADCGKNKYVAARADRGPLCENCYGRDRISFRPCDQCGNVERLFHHGLCPRCAAERNLRSLLTDDEAIPPQLQAIYEALSGSDPLRLLDWIAYSLAVPPLRRLFRTGRSITHEALDELMPSRAVQAIRAALVANDVLPFRDEHLAALERWLPGFLDTVADAGDRQLLHSYATWHHLRILRRKTGSGPARPGQTTAIRTDLHRAASLSEWLRERDLDLASCGQADIDTYLAQGDGKRHRVGAFIRWAAKNRRTADLQVPTRYEAPCDTIEPDHRWTLVKRLLDDAVIDPADRFAGLLILLFGQRVSQLVLLTVTDIDHATGPTTLKLGTHPVELPEPMDRLALVLLANRRTHIQLGHVDDHVWLFPGGLPGSHLSAARMSRRLNRIGIDCRRGRNTTMIEVAAEMPAAVVSALLGIDIKSATRWTKHSGGIDANYAAELAHRASGRSSEGETAR